MTERSVWGSRLGFILASAGSAVGLGAIWKFPYMAGTNGGSIFMLPYIFFTVTIGLTLLIGEMCMGRSVRAGAAGAFRRLGGPFTGIIGYISVLTGFLVLAFYSVVGGWCVYYMIQAFMGNGIINDPSMMRGAFESFASSDVAPVLSHLTFLGATAFVVYFGVEKGIERVSKIMMPILVVLSLIIAVYSVTRPGALEGVKYFLVPNLDNFSWMTVVSAMGQMFYSLSIAMGILITFGSYMKKDVPIESSTRNVEVFDTAIAIMAGLMIIPAVFAFSGGDPSALKAGPSLMFITIPKVFDSMGFGTVIGIAFFLLVLFAALTSSIALTESAVSTLQDELHWSRRKATSIMGVSMVLLGSLSSLGYGPLANVTVIGMQFLDFFDFLTNSVMMPIAAIASCILVSRVIGVDRIADEVTLNGAPFRRRKVFNAMIRFLCPFFAAIILISSIASAFGWISM